LPHATHIGSTVGTVLIFIFVLGKTQYHRERQSYYDGANLHRNTFHNLLPHLTSPNGTNALGLPVDLGRALRCVSDDRATLDYSFQISKGGVGLKPVAAHPHFYHLGVTV
jgi:hypothetical protein